MKVQDYTIKNLAPRIASGELSPVDLLDDILRRIKVIQPKVNAYITVLAEDARRQAEAAEREIQKGKYRGPLHGIPTAIKDIIYIQGVRCTCGSKILADYVPQEDATVITKLKDAGAVLVGTTNLHEFASGATNVNPHYGPCRNPWDTNRVSGGSSGGSAVALSTITAIGALGTDTSGSIRMPASLCGVFGLKPTYGRVSKHGVFPLSWALDHVGPITRSAWDAAALLRVVAGYDTKDETSLNAEVPDYVDSLEKHRKMRVAIPRNYFLDLLHPEVEKAFWDFVKKLESIGFRTHEMKLENSELIYNSWATIRRAEAAAVHQKWIEERPQDYGEDVRRMLEIGTKFTAVQYIKAQMDRKTVLEDFLRVLAGADVLVTPTTIIPAPPIDEATVTVAGKTMDVYSSLSKLTIAFNITGLPTMSLPVGFTSSGLPVGAQITGKPLHESDVLQASYAYETSEGLQDKFTPPLAKI